MKYSVLCLLSFLTLASCKGQEKKHEPAAKKPESPAKLYVKYHNQLDDINSAKEIESILLSINKDYDEFKVNESLTFENRYGYDKDVDYKHFADSLKIKAWTKEDFDRNGYTDLLVMGIWTSYDDHPIICLMDSGENKFYIKRITRKIFETCSLPVVTKIDSTPVIKYYTWEDLYTRENSPRRILKTDTLVYNFGDFVEYTSTPANHTIQKIEYSTTGCYGTCPIFNLTIDEDRTAIFEAVRFNDKEGKFRGIIDTGNYAMLTDLLNYIDFAKLENQYAVHWTDDQGCNLKITYDDGKVKAIHDYGLLETYGLDRTYDILFKLRENQKWTEVK